jgi:hypothetical protein
MKYTQGMVCVQQLYTQVTIFKKSFGTSIRYKVENKNSPSPLGGVRDTHIPMIRDSRHFPLGSP